MSKRTRKRSRSTGQAAQQGVLPSFQSGIDSAEVTGPEIPTIDVDHSMNITPRVSSQPADGSQAPLDAQADRPAATADSGAPDVPTVIRASGAALQANFDPPLGGRFAAARDARGWSRSELAERARLSLATIDHIEASRFDALGAPIYVRGFLRAYARAVDLPEVVVEQALKADAVAPPTLIAMQRSTWTERMSLRYKHPLVYALLTVVVLVPLVFLASPTTRERPQPLAALDAAGPSSSNPAGSANSDPASTTNAAVNAPMWPNPASSADSTTPVMASVAPYGGSTALATGPQPFVPQTGEPGIVVELSVAETSWVEFTSDAGVRLEYAQLPSGTVRQYRLVGAGSLVVGNVDGARVSVDGVPVDLSAHAARRVARLRLGESGPAPLQ